MTDPIAAHPAVKFYDENYTVLAGYILEVGKKQVLRAAAPDTCRFCGRSKPEVTFAKEAHAIPEALGNKSLSTTYECDTCNDDFGGGIENDFGNWSKPMRYVAQIRGKSGVPTLKKGSSGGWRLEVGGTGMEISQVEGEEIAELDHANKKLKLTLRRDPYTPIAVAKALTKMAITVLPEAELPNFQFALNWIRDRDHSQSPISAAPLIQTFVPGPRPFDRVTISVLRRRADVLEAPYAIVLLAFGNEALQMTLPCPERDQHLAGKDITMPAFPNPYELGVEAKGQMRRRVADFSGRTIIKGETFPVVFGFSSGSLVDPVDPSQA